jgi:putative aldouronate transport system permease protein
MRKLLGNQQNVLLTAMIIPTLVIIFIYRVLPSIVLIIAFKELNNEKGIWRSEWVGWQNFNYLFSSGVLLRIVFNTIVYNITFLVTIVILSLLIAYGLTQLKCYKMVSIYLTVFMIPSVLSWIIVSYISRSLLDGNGFINSVLEMSGQNTKNFYIDTRPWFFILSTAYIWKNIGFYILIFYSAMTAVKKELILSAAIDGAGKMGQFYKVVIPAISGTIITIIIFAIADVFTSDFGLFYNIPRNIGILYPVTDVIDTFAYRGIRTGIFEISVAVSFIQAFGGIIMSALLLSTMKVKRWRNERE